MPSVNLLLLTFLCLTVTVNCEIASWFTPTHQNAHNHPPSPGHEKNATADPRPLHEILNVTKAEMKARDVGSGVEAVAAAASATSVPPPIFQGGAFPPAVYPGGFPGGFPGFPGFGGGAGAGLNLGLDAGFGGGFLGGIYPYFPIIEKVIVIVGGGILILIFLALLQAFLVKGGFLGEFGDFGGFGASAAKSFSGAVDVDAGPFHASKSASGSIAFDQNAGLTQRVMNGVNTRW